MEILPLILTIIQISTSVFLILVVLFQSGKRAGLSGAISGAADAFLSKNQARTWDARLAKLTKWVAVLFIGLTITLNLL
ncbi:MAG: preprotein translocase subunit SecG [Oscillospiraceae bacterium]|nr:preprotein translocase subunit SecG [Oscillospiraceae bacterium]